MSKQSIIDSIKAKLSNQGKSSQNNETNKFKWSPKEGEKYSVRILPYRHGPDPFSELQFHYNLGNNIICPKASFPGDDSKRCAICEFGQELLIEAKKSKEKNNESWEQFKKLSPKLRVYVPILVREKEDEGARFWGISTKTYNSIGKYFIDPEYGDLSDPIDGRDLKVESLKQNGEKFATPTVMPAANKTKLVSTGNKNDDTKKAVEIISSVPEIFEVFPVPSYEETKKVLETYLAKAEESEENETEEKSSEQNNQPEVEETDEKEKESSSDETDDIEALLEKMNTKKK
jgi:hypothetical protein